MNPSTTARATQRQVLDAGQGRGVQVSVSSLAAHRS